MFISFWLKTGDGCDGSKDVFQMLEKICYWVVKWVMGPGYRRIKTITVSSLWFQLVSKCFHKSAELLRKYKFFER